MRNLKNHSGFSMMEMLVTLLILGLVAAIGVPSLSTFIEGNRLNAAVGDLQSAMQTARAEAVGRNSYVTLCKKNTDGDACSLVNAQGWQNGWFIFVDPDGDAVIDVGDEIILDHDPLLASLTFHGAVEVRHFITFRPSGQTSVTSTRTLILCDGRGFVADAKALIVSIMGRGSTMSATDTTATDCTP
jgi:type IV fimbrial biogenesis protein FimT